LLVGLITTSISFGQNVETRLGSAIKALETDPQFKHAILSMYVVDSKTGSIVFDKNSQLGLAPASCQKVVTSASAFEMLGNDYRYKTVIGHSGKIKDNILKGDLFIVASGDPTFGSWRWHETDSNAINQKIAGMLAASNIKRIEGNIILDESKWSTQATPNGWTWDDIGNYYGAGARGFNWYENQYDMILRPGKNIGDSVQIIRAKPELRDVFWANELKTGPPGSGDNSVIYLQENGGIGYLRGTIPAGKENFTISGAMPDPVEPFFSMLWTFFDSSHIELRNGFLTTKNFAMANKKWPLMTSSLSVITSPPFDSINYWFLKRSVNLYGEALVKTIAYEKTKFGSTDTGLNIIKEFWSTKGIERSALHIIDGSGLSPANRVTTNALVTVMQYAKQQSWFPSFYNALPELNGIKMKDGYISGVRAFTGYVKSKDGSEYSFSFIVNNFDGSAGTVREKMWKVLDILK